jgi:hypothetical protein
MSDINDSDRVTLEYATGDAILAAKIADRLANLDDLSLPELSALDGVTAGTQTAGKALVADSNLELDGLGVVKVADTLIGIQQQ